MRETSYSKNNTPSIAKLVFSLQNKAMRKFCLMLLLLGVYVLKGQQFTWTALPDHTYPDSLHHPFILGVASSEPDTAAVYIWTYAEPDSFTQVSMPFNWEFSADSGFSSVLFSGSVAADSNSSWTRTIHVTGLAPDTYYWYRFNDGRGNYSVTGRTRTLPTNSNNIRLVVSSCSIIRA